VASISTHFFSMSAALAEKVFIGFPRECAANAAKSALCSGGRPYRQRQ
jgi:hypothetical protein